MSFNPLTPESDLHVTSPCNIRTLFSGQVMRIDKCISYSETPPYGHLDNTVTSLLRPLFFWPPGKNQHTFSRKKTLVNMATPFIWLIIFAHW